MRILTVVNVFFVVILLGSFPAQARYLVDDSYFMESDVEASMLSSDEENGEDLKNK